jgi:PAS domain S-box-containing protein
VVAGDLTGRKQTKEALRESAERLQLAAAAAEFGIYTYDFVSGTGHWTPEFKAILGLKPDEPVRLDGDRLFVGLHPEDRSAFLSAMLAANDPSGSGLFLHDYRVIHPGGAVRWLHVRGQTSFAGKGRARRAVQATGVVLDITARKAEAKALRESEIQFRELFDSIHSGVAVYEAVEDGTDFVFKDVNRAGQRIDQTSKQEVLGRRVTEVFSGVREMGLLEVFQRVWRTGQSEHHPVVLYRDERLLGWRENYVYRLPSGEVVAVYDDITERKRAEEALRESEVKYRTLVEKANEAITIAQDGVYVFANKRLYGLLGVPAGTLEGKGFIDFVWPEDREQVMARYQKRIAGEPVTDAYDFRIIGAGGRLSWVFLSAATIQWKGRPATLNLITDITERKQAEEALRETEERFRTVYEKAAMGIAVTDVQGRILQANASFQRMLGRSSEDLVGRTTEQFTHPAEVEAERALFRRAMEEGRTDVQIQKRYVRSDGQIIWANLTISIIRDVTGRPQIVIGLVEDITERRQAEGDLRELSGQLLRLQDDERRRLARELHDTTAQELAAISMNLAVLKARAPELTTGAQAVLAETAALTDRCASEIRTMSYLLHPPALEALGLAGAGRDYADGFARRSGIRVDLQISDGLGRLSAEIELALFRVLQESLANIHRHSGSRTASIRLARTKGQIWLEVRDTGRGMNLAEQNLTEGPLASGLGVGIPGMRERMRQLGGMLKIESDAQGTCVIAIVPLDRKTDQP